jgi:signal transduction histidine kinase
VGVDVGSRVVAWSDRHRFASDAVIAALIGLVVVPMTAGSLGSGSALSPSVGGFLSLVMVAAMAWRRTRPVASAAVVYSAALIHILLGEPVLLPVDLLVPWSFWSVLVHGPRWAGRVAFAGAMVGSALVGLQLTGSPSGALAVGGGVALVFLTTWSLAQVRQSRRAAMDALVDRARRLEVERDQQAHLGAAAERARIAREMHDIVAHSLSVIVAQADGGRYAAAQDPRAAQQSLETIAATGRSALDDMRRLLGVLREESPDTPGRGPEPGVVSPTAPGSSPDPVGAPDVSTPTGPLPGVVDLAGLVDQVRGGGMRVRLVERGAPRGLPAGMGLVLYRITQEALTNVLKHAGPDPEVTVGLDWLVDRVVLEVADDGRGAATISDGLGQGLVGMRERAGMFDGQLWAGPAPGGGFLVRASLPTPDGSVGASRAPSGTGQREGAT